MEDAKLKEVLGTWEGYRLGTIGRESVPGIDGPEEEVWIELDPDPEHPRRCSGCGRTTTTIHETYERWIRDLSILACRTWLLVQRVRLACPTCGPKVEALDWLETHERSRGGKAQDHRTRRLKGQVVGDGPADDSTPRMYNIRMATANTHRYIVSVPGILGGEPVIDGTRTPVRAIVELWRMGTTPEEIPTHLPHVTLAQVFDALSYFSDHQAQITDYIDRNRVPDPLIDPRVQGS